jgi:F-type H+-transporting ATPase subunit delta
MTDAAWQLARALLREALALGQAEEIEADLARLAQVLADPDVARFVRHPRIPLAEKERVLHPTAGTELARRLLDALLDSRETDLIQEIHDSYARLRKRHAGLVDVEVRTPQPLTPGQQERIRAAVRRFTGRTVELRPVVDPELIGGVRLRIDGRVVDDSLRARLNTLEERLLAP